MSKVKYTLDKNLAAKAHRSLRIADTKLKKNNRINNCKNDVYGYGFGYWLTKGHPTYEYEYIDVPERKIPARDIYGLHFPEKTIPAYKRKVVKNIIESTNTERPVRMDLGKSKKYHRKQAARKVRYYTGDLSNSDYKKVYDIWWNVL